MDILRVPTPLSAANCYLLSDGSCAALVDPGAGDDGTLAGISRLLSRRGLTLCFLFLTHGHYDHVGGVSALRAAYPGLAVFLHPGDAGGAGPLMPTAGLGQITLWREGDVVRLGGLNVEVLHTPGHTGGSVCLRCRDVLFTGDTLFEGTAGRTDLPGGSGPALANSLRRLAGLEGDFTLYPGHGQPTTLDAQRRSNPFLAMALSGDWPDD